MCNQTVCLVAAEMERQGISTVMIQLLRNVAEKVRPRAPCLFLSNMGIPWACRGARAGRWRDRGRTEGPGAGAPGFCICLRLKRNAAFSFNFFYY